MRLKNVLIVVKDIERARRFYHDLFGLELVLDNEGNMRFAAQLGLVTKVSSYEYKISQKLGAAFANLGTAQNCTEIYTVCFI